MSNLPERVSELRTTIAGDKNDYPLKPAEFLKLPWPLQEPPLPLLAFFRACRFIAEFVDFLISEVAGLGCRFCAWLSHWRRSRAFLKLISDVGFKLSD